MEMNNMANNAKRTLVDKVNNSPEQLRQRGRSTKHTSNGKKTRKSFFFKLSLVGRVMFVIYMLILAMLVFSIATALLNRGTPVMGSRQRTPVEISGGDIRKVNEALQKEIPADSIRFDVTAYRAVVTADLKNDVTKNQAKEINEKIYKIIDGILPISKYFSSKDKLNYDLAIYSSDIIPTDTKTSSQYIMLTYKNSKMAKSQTYNLMSKRDKKSYDEVVESMEKAKSN
jgi:hypothetical protein